MAEIISFNEPKINPPACSFCKKPKTSSRPLIGDPSCGGPYICYACVEKCNDLLAMGEPTEIDVDNSPDAA